MGILAWILLGLIAGFIAHRMVGGAGGLLMDIVVGILGAIIGGFLANLVGAAGVTGFNLYSIVVAVVGACVLLLLVRLFTGRRRKNIL
jgi:uncharacterized membrane protein YeaQ/YmgE (transglycosylase-associated protein family)